MKTPQIEKSWLNVLQEEFAKEYMSNLRSFLIEEKKNSPIYPPNKLIFNAFNLTAYDDVKVVILGQDPYHGIGQAHGLAFSVMKGVSLPPSLLNIYKELNNEFGYPISNNGDLTSWAEQGVLLLNTTLTVRQSKPQSHFGQGWERFTDAVISTLNNHSQNIVFLLWGSNAQKKAQLINNKRHKVLQTSHPSPLSAHRGFLGCNHFRMVNEYLHSNGQQSINWKVD